MLSDVKLQYLVGTHSAVWVIQVWPVEWPNLNMSSGQCVSSIVSPNSTAMMPQLLQVDMSDAPV